VSYSYATTATTTFSKANAEYVASKVITDLKQFQRWYAAPADDDIEGYSAELVALLPRRYMSWVEYGFRRAGKWQVSMRYEVRADGTLDTDSRAGGVPRGHDVTGATFYSFMHWSSEWSRLTPAEKQAIYDPLPFNRGIGTEPGYASGSFTYDRTYSASGNGVTRRTFSAR
jgi:hypothetical protein